jgi:mannose-6-phosphate isomerase-like protein (cupin superfamily)
VPVVDIAEKLSPFSDHWSSKVVARLDDHEVELVRLEGELVRHTHPGTDELFLVVEGTLTIRLRHCPTGERSVTPGPGQLYVVPRGVEHCPTAESEASELLISPAGVVNTGSAASGDRTASYDESLLD